MKVTDVPDDADKLRRRVQEGFKDAIALLKQKSECPLSARHSARYELYSTCSTDSPLSSAILSTNP